MKISKIVIDNFKRISRVELPLSDINILVGANGCGKSSIVQAVHLAACVMRQADRVDSTRTSTVDIDDLDYLPTDNYKTLGHNATWGNKEGTPSSDVALSFQKPDGSLVSASCKLRSARNAGISITGTIAPDLTSSLRSKNKFFSAYIPGISGIPNKEERKSRKVILKACSYGDSNVILRNALLLLKEKSNNNITLIETWISRILRNMSINVSHDNDHDLYISCDITIDGTTRPIELVGTGYIQLIQIFCYILLFNPGVLLIDEPDIHLHPHIQERLVAVLAEVAKERGIRVILTTHSPFIVRGAPIDTKVCWLQNGVVESDNRQLVELALGWGAFGKKLIVLSEDTNMSLFKKLIAQWPEIDRNVAFYPGNGFKNIPTPTQAKELSETLGGKYKILVHRDRDSLTDTEATQLIAKYEAEGVNLWLPAESDVEAYFCSVVFLEEYLGCTQQQASDYVSTILNRDATPIKDQFHKQRAAHNDELYRAGGSPTNDAVWATFQGRPLKGAKGKHVYKQLKNVVPANAFAEDKILNARINGNVALDLKLKIEQVLAG